MEIKDIQNYIAKRNCELWQSMQDSVTNDEQWCKLKGAYDELEKLRFHILTMTNPHKRLDIEKIKQRIKNETISTK